MKVRSSFAAGLTIATLAAAGAVQARDVEVEINTAPPPDRQVVVPAPREGYVYERPHYDWDGRAYEWTEGRYIEERPGHKYVQPKVEHRGEHFYFSKGHWDDD